MNVERKQSVFTAIRQRSLADRGLLNFILWVVVCGLLSGLFFAIDYIDGTTVGYRLYESEFAWAPGATIFVCIIGFNLAAVDILRHFVKHHGRNMVAWTTAIIVFTPFLAGIAYLLTWPKNQQLIGGIEMGSKGRKNVKKPKQQKKKGK